MTLKLVNNTDKKVYNFDVDDVGDSRIYYHFNVKLEAGMPDGEYTYTLYDGDSFLATGLCQIGDYVPTKKSEYTNNKTYKQYQG